MARFRMMKAPQYAIICTLGKIRYVKDEVKFIVIVLKQF